MVQPRKGFKKVFMTPHFNVKISKSETSLLKCTSAIQYYLKSLFNFSQAYTPSKPFTAF